MRLVVIFFCLVSLCQIACTPQQDTTTKPLHCIENQRCPDQGDGTYLNPILGGDYPDPSVLRVGDDYYMTHSSFEHVPGLLIWHSRDLVNWDPVCHALTEYVGMVWAPDFIEHDGMFYIYFPIINYAGYDGQGSTNAVVTAPSPDGPWSPVTDLKVGHIDPGHVADEEGNRYLHLSGGHFVALSDDGLSVSGEVKKVHEGWKFPDDWLVECFCLESPKLTRHKGYYYLTYAEGGTAGPPTSHMVASSRSKTPWGPWENSPHNPIVHTDSAGETWWSTGHGTLVSTPDDDWWIIFHGYENGFRTLGRQTLMLPVEWTDDGWFRVPEGAEPDKPIAKPFAEGEMKGMALSDDFEGDELGFQWHFNRDYDPERFSIAQGRLTLEGRGSSPADCGPLLQIPVNRSYEITAELEIEGGVTGGLLLYHSEGHYAGIGWSEAGMVKYERDAGKLSPDINPGKHAWLKIINDRHQIEFNYSADGKQWVKLPGGAEVSGYHNSPGNFLSLRAGIFAAGEGKLICHSYIYRGLD